MSKWEDEDGIEGPFNKAMDADYHAESAANPDWPYEHRCVGCGEEWPRLTAAAIFPALRDEEGR